MKKLNLLLFSLAFLIFEPAFSAPRTVFIQLFEWPWKDVAQECEIYLGPAGFSAVQVSPPHEHINWQNNPWWERYQVVSYKLNSRSGDESEFVDMVQRCKKAGVDIYVDAVLNHTTGVPGGVGFSGTTFKHYDYPGLYRFDDFHHCGRNGNDNISNYDDLYELQNCELLDLADLATEKENVRSTLARYLNHLLDLGVAGFRIDAAKHVPIDDLMAIKMKLKRSAYFFSEVIAGPNAPVSYSDYLPLGDVMAYSYSKKIAQAFLDKDFNSLSHVEKGFPASSDSIVFLTNHDLERNTNIRTLRFDSPDQNLYRLANVFLLTWPFGYPQLYSGYRFKDFDEGPPLTSSLKTLPILDSQNNCQKPWTCEHRLPEVAKLVDFRNQTDRAFKVQNWWSNGKDALAFSRGSLGFVVINSSSNELIKEFTTSMSDGYYCNILEDDSKSLGSGCTGYLIQNGKIKLNVAPNSAIVLLKPTIKKKSKL